MRQFLPSPLSLALMLSLGPGAQAATVTVNTATDSASLANAGDGQCSLREAIRVINEGSASSDCPATGFGNDDTIVFDLAGENSITLEDAVDADIEIEKALTLRGPSPDGVTIRRGFVTSHDFRLLEVTEDAPLVLENITLTGGETKTEGGALWSWGDVTLISSTLSNNTVSGTDGFGGGGLFAAGSITLNNSTVSGNASGDDVGGLCAEGNLVLNNSTVSGNSADDDVGGIYGGGSVTLLSSTISGNAAADNVGGIQAMGSVTMSHTILSGNTARAHPDLYTTGTLTAEYSILGTGIDVTGEGNISTDDPRLAALTDNGGSTPTRLPLLGSPAIDNGSSDSYTTSQMSSVDQRGMQRPQDGNGDNIAVRDIGAVEHGKVEPIPTLSTLGLILLSGLMGLVGWHLSRRSGGDD